MEPEQILEPAGEVIETPELDAEGIEAPSPSDEPDDEPKKAPWWEKRFAEITRQKYEAQREADRLKWELEQVKPKEVKEEPKDPLAEIGAEPKEDDFEDYDDFRRAQRAYDRKLAVLEAKAELMAFQAAEKERVQQQAQAKTLEDWSTQGTGKFSDFSDVALKHPNEGGPPYSDAMREAVLASDKSHEIAYHLGKNPQEARRLAELNPVRAAYEIAKLEVKLASIKPKTISDAPGPLKPLSPSKSGDVDLYDPQLPMNEFAKRWREKRKR